MCYGCYSFSRRGVPSNLINVIKGLHVGAQARVREAGQFSEALPLQMGLKQGSLFAPLLFNIFLVQSLRLFIID